MHTAIDEIKIRAALLHKQLQSGDDAAIERIRALPEFAGREPSVWLASVQRKHALATLAREMGLANWPEASALLAGRLPEQGNFGVLLHPRHCSGFLNEWFANLAQARESLTTRGGYLLAYRRQFFVVTPLYIETLGLAAAHGEWRSLEHDWCHEGGDSARASLYAQLIGHRPV